MTQPLRRVPARYLGDSSRVFASMPGLEVSRGDVVWVFPNDFKRRDLEPATDAGDPPDDLDELEELLEGLGKRPWRAKWLSDESGDWVLSSLWAARNRPLIRTLRCPGCGKRTWDKFIRGRGQAHYGRLVSKTPISGHVTAMNAMYEASDGPYRLRRSNQWVTKEAVLPQRTYQADFPERLALEWRYACNCGETRRVTNTALVRAYIRAIRQGHRELYGAWMS